MMLRSNKMLTYANVYGYNSVTEKFEFGIGCFDLESNYRILFCCPVLSDPVKRREYDSKGMLYVYDCNVVVRISPIPSRSIHYVLFTYTRLIFLQISIYCLQDYLNRYKGLILTCNGLGMRHSIL